MRIFFCKFNHCEIIRVVIAHQSAGYEQIQLRLKCCSLSNAKWPNAATQKHFLSRHVAMIGIDWCRRLTIEWITVLIPLNSGGGHCVSLAPEHRVIFRRYIHIHRPQLFAFFGGPFWDSWNWEGLIQYIIQTQPVTHCIVTVSAHEKRLALTWWSAGHEEVLLRKLLKAYIRTYKWHDDVWWYVILTFNVNLNDLSDGVDVIASHALIRAFVIKIYRIEHERRSALEDLVAGRQLVASRALPPNAGRRAKEQWLHHAPN